MEWQSLQLRDFLRVWSAVINLRERPERGRLNAREYSRANHLFAACPQGDPRGNCVWRSHRPSVRFSGLSKVERDLTWHVRSDWKRRVINRSLPLSRFARLEFTSVCAKRPPSSVSSFRKRITRRQAMRWINPQCRTIKAIRPLCRGSSRQSAWHQIMQCVFRALRI